MKKLFIIDHQGEVVFSANVYMEGTDFIHIEEAPKVLWVKEIRIFDPSEVEQHIPTPPELFPKAFMHMGEVTVSENAKPDLPKVCTYCDWEGSTLECNFGHDDFYCPSCGYEALADSMTTEDAEELKQAIREREETEQAIIDNEVRKANKIKAPGTKEGGTNGNFKTTNNKGTGNKGTGKADKLEGTEDPHQEPTTRPAN